MYLIANWKQNKSSADLEPWLDALSSEIKSLDKDITIVIAMPYTLLGKASDLLNSNKYQPLGIKLAAQDISKFEDGPHTGEVGTTQLRSLVEYVICGHSERRSMGESSEEVAEKVERAVNAGLIPIICFGNIDEFNVVSGFANTNALFAYEPPESISTSVVPGGPKPATPESIKDVKSQTGLTTLVYGGSVDNNSIEGYLSLDFINGFLIGSASLDPVKFSKVINIVS